MSTPILRTKDFVRRQAKIALIFSTVVLCAKWLPKWVSLNPKGAIYQTYYEDALPFSLFDVLLVVFVVRLIVVSGLFWLQKRKQAA